MDRSSQPRFYIFAPAHAGRGRALRRVAGLCCAIAITLGLGLATNASAQSYRHFLEQDGAYDRTGVYLGGGLVGGFTTRLESELTEIPGVDDVEVDPSVGVAARLGARISPRVAIEAHYEWMDDFETSVAGVEVAETTTQTLTADVKGYLATGRVQPYLSAGAGFLRAKSDDPVTTFQKTDTDFALRFGGGLDVYVTEVVGVSLDTSYVLPTGDVQDLDYVSVGAGVFFRF